MSTISYLDRLLDPMTDAFTPALARRIAELQADDDLMSEIDALRYKANQGTLSPDENTAYKEFVDALDLISVIQSKARRFLARQAG